MAVRWWWWRQEQKNIKKSTAAIVKENNISGLNIRVLGHKMRALADVLPPAWLPIWLSLTAKPKRSTRSNACLIETILFFHHRLFVITWFRSFFLCLVAILCGYMPASFCILTHIWSITVVAEAKSEFFMTCSEAKIAFFLFSLNLPSWWPIQKSVFVLFCRCCFFMRRPHQWKQVCCHYKYTNDFSLSADDYQNLLWSTLKCTLLLN